MSEARLELWELRAIDEDLAKLAVSAAIDEIDDPRSSIIKAGLAAEQLAQWVGRQAHCHARDGETSKDYLIRLQFDARLPAKIGTDFHSIRRERNRAAHTLDQSKLPAPAIMDCLEGISRWIVGTYLASPSVDTGAPALASDNGLAIEAPKASPVVLDLGAVQAGHDPQVDVSLGKAACPVDTAEGSTDNERDKQIDNAISVSALEFGMTSRRYVLPFDTDTEMIETATALIKEILEIRAVRRILVVCEKNGIRDSIWRKLYKHVGASNTRIYSRGDVHSSDRILFSTMRSLIRPDYPGGGATRKENRDEIMALLAKERHEYREFSTVITLDETRWFHSESRWPYALMHIDVCKGERRSRPEKFIEIKLRK